MDSIRTSPVTAVVTLLKPLGRNRTVEFYYAWPEGPWRPEPGDTIAFCTDVDLKVVSDVKGGTWRLAHEGPWVTAESLAETLRRSGVIRNVQVRP